MTSLFTKSITTVAAAALLAGAALQPALAVQVGQSAPDISLPRQGGGTATLDQLRGKVVYLDFWASWCGPCRQTFPWMNELQARYGAHGFSVLAVNVDAKQADAEKFLAQVPAQFPVAFDSRGEAPGRYELKGMPSSFLIGPDGKVLMVHSGFKPEERKELESKIEAALSGKP